MEEDVIHFAQAVFEKNTIPFHVLKEGVTDNFDHNLRGALFGDERYRKDIDSIFARAEAGTLYKWHDVFYCTYYVLRHPEENLCYLIGPFLTKIQNEQAWNISGKKIGIPVSKQNVFEDVFQTMTIVRDELFLYNCVKAFADCLYEGRSYSYVEVNDTGIADEVYTEAAADNMQSIHNIEKRYRLMRSIMNEVTVGNTSAALEYLREFQSMSRNPRLENVSKDTKSWLVTYNTSLRNTLDQCGIHPYDIHQISTRFSYEIENARESEDKEKMMIKMTKEYCNLVNQKKTKAYSQLIQEVLIYIRMNVSEDIRLSAIAQEHNVNASYLSKKFHDEVHMTITEYINQLRIEESLAYFKHTSLQVKDIAYKVGIFDVNYYTRLFKKYKQMTPSEYRRQITENQ